VLTHPGPPSVWILRKTHSLRTGPDVFSAAHNLSGQLNYPVVLGGGTPFLPPVTEDVPLEMIETSTFGSRVIYERYGRARDESD
jgi:hypothetical protein